MPSITIDIGTQAELTRAVDAFCGAYNYQATITNGGGQQIANPESRNAFAKRQVAEFVKKVIRNYEADRDSKIAIAAAEANSSSLAIS